MTTNDPHYIMDGDESEATRQQRVNEEHRDQLLLSRLAGQPPASQRGDDDLTVFQRRVLREEGKSETMAAWRAWCAEGGVRTHVTDVPTDAQRVAALEKRLADLEGRP